MLMLSLALLAADPVAAQPAPPAAPPTPPAEKQVCRSMPRELGSMMSGKRVCKTRAEWKEYSRQSMDGQRSPRNEARWVGGNRP